MASGILKSLKKIVFAEDIFYGRIVRGSFEKWRVLFTKRRFS